MKTTMTGTLEECIKHFSGRLLDGPPRQRYRRRNALAELLGVGQRAAEYWFTKFVLPIGENKVRLHLFMELSGYKISDTPKLESPFKELAEMIGLQIVSVAEVAKRLKIQSQQVLCYALRGQDTSTERKAAITELVTTSSEERLRRLALLKSKMSALEIFVKPESPETLKASNPSVAPENNGDGKNHQVTETSSIPLEVMLLAQLINAAAPLAERVASNEFSAKDRQTLRRLTKTATGRSNNVFDLSNSLNSCCGERARAQLDSKEQEKV